MSRHEVFRKFGLFTVEGFFDRTECDALRSEAGRADHGRAHVSTKDGRPVVDEAVRRTKLGNLAPETIARVEGRLLAVRPMLESHFRVELGGCTDTAVLIYEPGDFFHYHKDVATSPRFPDVVRHRKVSAVIFLNDEDQDGRPGAYAGGQLTLYGLIDFPGSERYGLPMIGEAGLLVAFRADLPHEVTPVTRGERCTIVSWFVA